MKYLILILVLLATPAFAEVAVIVNPSVSADVDAGSVERLFLGRAKALDDGTELTPVVQSPSSELANAFYKGGLKKSGAQFKAYWSKMVFTGKARPLKELGSDAEVMALVASDPRYIGYVDAASVDGSVKVVQKY